jgi:chromosomal replication initiator protein
MNTVATKTLPDIATAVSVATGVDLESIRGSSKAAPIYFARSLAMYLAREHTASTYEEIGKYFRREAKSATYAHKQVESCKLLATFATVRRVEDMLGVE